MSDDGAGHYHDLRGRPSGPRIPTGDDHIHEIMMDNIIVTSGPSIGHAEAKKDMDKYGTGLGTARDLSKSIMPDLVDPSHVYVFKSGEFGICEFWYVDALHNYWKYTNAPPDHPDYDPYLGDPIKLQNQPDPTENPQFFTEGGQKRHMAIPEDVLSEENDEYDPIDPKNVWFEIYDRDGEIRYVYLDSDVRENIDLWVQYQLRITDANLTSMRKFANEKFVSDQPKDKVVGAIVMLMDQGLYEMEELLNATVSDLQFIDNTVKLLGRKFVCDPAFLDFLTSLVGVRDPASPLFAVMSIRGEDKVGIKYMASIFSYLRVSPTYLLAWHASHIYSRAVNRLSFEDVDSLEVDGRAMSEVKRAFGTQKDMQHLVDHTLRAVLLQKYGEVVTKSIVPRVEMDEYSTLMIISELDSRQGDEIEFSTWLHAQPMHDITPEQQAMVEEEVSRVVEELEEAEAAEEVEESEAADQEAGAVDTDQSGGASAVDTEGGKEEQ